MESTKRTQIMLIVPMLDQGGLERVCALTAKLLNPIYGVHLVVFNTTGMIYDVSGVDLIDLKLGAAGGKAAKAANVIRRTVKVRKLKKMWNIQLSYSFGPTANIVNILSKYKDVTWAGIRGYGTLSDKASMRLVCRQADRIVSCTRVMEHDIASMFAVNNLSTLYNPCNLAEIRQLSKQEIPREFEMFFQRPGKTVVSMGRAHDVKGFWHLIKSFYLAKKQLHALKLVLIGDGDYSEYKAFTERLHIEEDVLFTGVQKNPFPILAGSDVYALTSDSEGFPNALIEAMAAGLPCVSVNCKTGPAEILQKDYRTCSNQELVYYADYGILTPVFTGSKDLTAGSFTPEEKIFASELVKLLTDDKMCRHYRQASMQRAGDFGTESYVENIAAMVEQDLKRKI